MSADFLSIDPESRLPVYQQVARHFAAEIASGRLGAGARLPAIRRLALAVGLHRDTIALAYEQLAKEGWVEAQVGRGTFVRDPGADTPHPANATNSPLLSHTEARVASPTNGASRTGGDAEIELATQVEQLIALGNTRPRYATGEDVVALHKLIPDPRFYPIEDFRDCMNAAISEDGPALFSYASPEGDPRLRSALNERFAAYGVARSEDEVVLCHGASQGISLALRLFVSPGEQVAVEVPTYANVLSACAGLGIGTAPVAVDEGGPDPESLDRTLARPEVKAFYTIPSFHNPLGTSTSLARRRVVLEIAEAHGVPIIEDGFEMDLRFRGEELPPLAALDESGGVVLLFSFSKSLFPGIRVGSISARGRALEGLVALKHATDLSDALPIQAALARFLESGAYDRHLTTIREMLGRRHRAMDEALAASMPEGTRWTRPDGGYQRWVELPFDVDTRDLLADAARAGVLFSPGALFMPDARPSRALRLTVSSAEEQEIHRGVAALGEVAQRRVATQPVTGRAAGMHL
jgi:DNA-binding transcriptional MocR family regulator